MQSRRSKLEQMPRNLHRSVSDYLTKIKRQTPHLHITPSSLSSTTSKLFGGCKHPRSLSSSLHHHPDDHDNKDHHHDHDAATLEDIDRFLFENFRSLYGRDGEDGEEEDIDDPSFTRKNKEKVDHHHRDKPVPEILFDGSPKFFMLPPDLCGSHRFFVSPSSSGSLVEDTSPPMRVNSPMTGNMSDDVIGSTSTNTTNDPHAKSPAVPNNHNITGAATDRGVSFPVDDCIVILAASPSPYDDFRRSMQEIIEARVRHGQRVDWDFLEEILFCYLRLNEKKQHRYILGAFVDLIVAVREASSIRGERTAGIKRGGCI